MGSPSYEAPSTCSHERERAWYPRILPCPYPSCPDSVGGEEFIVPVYTERWILKRRWRREGDGWGRIRWVKLPTTKRARHAVERESMRRILRSIQEAP